MASLPHHCLECTCHSGHSSAGPASGRRRPTVWALLHGQPQSSRTGSVCVHAPHNLPRSRASLLCDWVHCPHQHPPTGAARPKQGGQDRPAHRARGRLYCPLFPAQLWPAFPLHVRARSARRLGNVLRGAERLRRGYIRALLLEADLCRLSPKVHLPLSHRHFLFLVGHFTKDIHRLAEVFLQLWLSSEALWHCKQYDQPHA